MLDEKMMEYILEVEGGYVHHPADRGGETKYGITRKTLENAFKRRIVTHVNVKDLTPEEANAIYYKMYYVPSEGEWIEENFGKKLALIHLDTAINSGVRVAEKFFQRTINYIAGDEVLKVDGFIGPITKRVSQKILSDDVKIRFACVTYLWLRAKYYTDIVNRNHTQRVFLLGWLNRLEKLEKYLEKLNGR